MGILCYFNHVLNTNSQQGFVYAYVILFEVITSNAAFLPAVNTTSQPGNLSRTVSPVVYTTGDLGASRDFPNFDLHP